MKKIVEADKKDIANKKINDVISKAVKNKKIALTDLQKSLSDAANQFYGDGSLDENAILNLLACYHFLPAKERPKFRNFLNKTVYPKYKDTENMKKINLDDFFKFATSLVTDKSTSLKKKFDKIKDNDPLVFPKYATVLAYNISEFDDNAFKKLDKIFDNRLFNPELGTGLKLVLKSKRDEASEQAKIDKEKADKEKSDAEKAEQEEKEKEAKAKEDQTKAEQEKAKAETLSTILDGNTTALTLKNLLKDDSVEDDLKEIVQDVYNARFSDKDETLKKLVDKYSEKVGENDETAKVIVSKVLDNENASEDTIDSITQIKNFDISKSALDKSKKNSVLVKSASEQAKIAQNPNAKASEISELALKSKNPTVRMLAMANPNISDNILEEIVQKEGGKQGPSAFAKQLLDASSESAKQADMETLVKTIKPSELSAAKKMAPQNFALLSRIVKNTKTPTMLLNKISKQVKNDEIKGMIKQELSKRGGNPFETEPEDDVSGYSAELSLNRIVGRLHDVSMEAIENKYGKSSFKGWLRGLKRAANKLLGIATAGVYNDGMIEGKDGQPSIFRGVTNSRDYHIFVIPHGIFGKKKAATDVLKLYLKYFTGQDVNVNLDDIAQEKKDVLGQSMNVWVYSYRITYKIYKESANFETLLGESMKTNSSKKNNVWLTENINPFNHNEKIVSENHSEKLVKLIDEGHNLEAKNELKELLKEKIKAKFSETLKHQN